MSEIISPYIILAIVGLPGSGKTEATNICKKIESAPGIKLFSSHVYFGDVVFEEMKRLGLEVNEENERKTREGLRKAHGMDMAAKLSLSKIELFYKTGNVLVESHYSTQEYIFLKEQYGENFKVMSILAPPTVREDRLLTRPLRPLSREDTCSRSISQVLNLHQGGPIALADYFIINVGLSLSELEAKVVEGLIELNILKRG